MERHGTRLLPSKRIEMERIKSQLNELSLRYVENLNCDPKYLLLSEQELAGMPHEFIKVCFKTHPYLFPTKIISELCISCCLGYLNMWRVEVFVDYFTLYSSFFPLGKHYFLCLKIRVEGWSPKRTWLGAVRPSLLPWISCLMNAPHPHPHMHKHKLLLHN